MNVSRLTFGSLLCAILMSGPTILAQTQVGLRTQAKDVDFSAAPATKPMKTGLSLPSTCAPGDFFFRLNSQLTGSLFACLNSGIWALQGIPVTDPSFQGVVLSATGSTPQWTALGGDVSGAPGSISVTKLRNRPLATATPQPGQVLAWSGTEWTPQNAAGGTGGVTIKSGSTIVSNTSVANFVAGPGVSISLLPVSGETRIQHQVDTSFVSTRADLQAGVSLFCNSTGGSSTAYTCNLNPTLAAYQTGMVLEWRPDVSASGGATTLEVDTLGARAVKLSNGTSDPTSADIQAGRLHAVWYDGTAFRLLNDSSMSQSSGTRPSCTAALRGKVWHTFSGAGVKDIVAVCAKDAGDGFDWRVLY